MPIKKPQGTSAHGPRPSGLVLSSAAGIVIVVLYAINLRTGIASVAPVLPDIQRALGVSPAAAGILTALPGFAFAAMGSCAVPLAKKIGLTPTLVAGALLLLAGTIIRPFVPQYWLFLLCSLGLVTGIALGNVILPAWVKAYSRGRTTVQWMSSYAATMAASGAIAPLSVLWFSGADAWKLALAVWAIPAAAAVAVWAWILAKTGKDEPSAKHPDVAAQEATEEASTAIASTPIYKSKTAVAMLFFFGLQSSAAYMMMGWLPQLYMDRGVDGSTASIALAVIGFVGIIGGFVMPPLIAHMKDLRPVPFILPMFFVAAWLGIYFAVDAAPILWAVLMGIGGLCFPLALALLTARTRDPLVTARLSGFVQPGGYLMAGLLPMITGVVYNWLDDWNFIIFGMIALACVQAFMGLGAAQNVYIDDELRDAAG